MASKDPATLLESDRTDRETFATGWEDARKMRLEPKGKQRPAFTGAPIGEEPLIDDNVRALASAEVSMLWSGRTLAVFPVSTSQVDAVRAYTDGQEAHHANMSFQDEFRALARRSGEVLGERYAGD